MRHRQHIQKRVLRLIHTKQEYCTSKASDRIKNSQRALELVYKSLEAADQADVRSAALMI